MYVCLKYTLYRRKNRKRKEKERKRLNIHTYDIKEEGRQMKIHMYLRSVVSMYGYVYVCVMYMHTCMYICICMYVC